MTDTLKARDADDVEQAIVWALAEGKTLDIAGQGSKRALGRPSQSDLTLDLSSLSGVTLYEPDELVLSAKAGTPLAEIESLVAGKAQELAFEPADYGPLLGGKMGSGTLGGALAINVSGPRRIKAGAARDHFLGATAVSGRGETFKTGGRVVKNVTGYDLCKLLAGSYGTLAAMTDVTIKTLPRAETEQTVLLSGLKDETAMRAMAAAMGSSCDVSGAAHLPAGIAADPALLSSARALTAFRLEGVAPSVARRKEMLVALLREFGAGDVIEAQQSKPFWRAIRDVTVFAASGPADPRPVWRISTAPGRGAELAARLEQKAPALFYDWAGGLIWAMLPPSDDAGSNLVRPAVAALGGHATLIRAPAAIRASNAVFEPQDAVSAALTKRVKDSFDPKGILNPGRMWAGV